MLDGRPIAVTGSRDSTLRVWDIQRGRCIHVLEGHGQSVRCLDVSGNLVVSGSYDCNAKVRSGHLYFSICIFSYCPLRDAQLWNVDTGECLRTFRGHYHQIYAVTFDGERIATGSLDSTVRVWSAQTGYEKFVVTSTGGQLTTGYLSIANVLPLSKATPPL